MATPCGPTKKYDRFDAKSQLLDGDIPSAYITFQSLGSQKPLELTDNEFIELKRKYVKRIVDYATESGGENIETEEAMKRELSFVKAVIGKDLLNFDAALGACREHCKMKQGKSGGR